MTVYDPKGKPCPKCGRKGLHFPMHPHASGYKDYDHVSCKFCQGRFTVKTPIRSAWQTAVVGGLAAAAAFLLAKLFSPA